MNREILFRGRRLDSGEWVTGRLITDDRDGKGDFRGGALDDET